jgi:lipopolysaccharide export system protein LptA
MNDWARALAAGLALLLVDALAVAAPSPGNAAPVMSVGVAPFVGAGGQVRGALAGILAHQLAESPEIRVVFPEDLKSLAVSQPEAREIRRWAESRQVDVIVVGSEKPFGAGGVKLAIELRSGQSGAAVGRYTAAADDLEYASPAMEEVADKILLDLGHEQSQEGAAPPQGEFAEDPKQVRFAVVEKGQPVAIYSDELEVTQDSGARHIVFSGNVRVKQGTVTLVADRLDAYYARGGSSPEYLEATGSVRVRDGNKKARCDNAVYHNTDRRVQCKGRAVLVQGCDRVRGQEIEFDLEEERVRVLGAASVVLQGEEQDANCAGGLR